MEKNWAGFDDGARRSWVAVFRAIAAMSRLVADAEHVGLSTPVGSACYVSPHPRHGTELRRGTKEIVCDPYLRSTTAFASPDLQVMWLRASECHTRRGVLQFVSLLDLSEHS